MSYLLAPKPQTLQATTATKRENATEPANQHLRPLSRARYLLLCFFPHLLPFSNLSLALLFCNSILNFT